MSRRPLLIAAVALVAVLGLLLVVRLMRPGAATPDPTPEPAAAASLPAITATLPAALPVTATTPVTPLAAGEPAVAGAVAPSADAAPVRFVQAVASAPDVLNPLLSTDATTQAIAQLIYPPLIGQDAQSGRLSADGLAARWDISPDGGVYTLTLRSDLRWSDGVPVSADDVRFTLEAVRDPATASPFRPKLANVVDVQTPAPDTVVLTLASPACATMAALVMPVLPAHLFTDVTGMAAAPQSILPRVGAGPFLLDARTDDGFRLLRNPDAPGARPVIDELVLRVIAEPEARVAALADGSVDMASFEDAWIAQAQAVPGHTLTLTPEDRFDFVALNLADPAAPTPGRDDAGALIPQPPHPVLGEQRVRQALAVAVDYAALLPPALQPAAYRVTSYVLPGTAWATAPELVPVQTNPTLAGELLDSVGWRDEDGDGVRSRDGVPLALTLLVNNDSAARLDTAQALATAWRSVGVDVTVEAATYEEVLARVLAQQTDAALLGWDNLGFDPGANPFWHSREDVPGAGFNFVSLQDAEVDAWLDEARTAPGCDPTLRADRFRRVQERIDIIKPYILLHGRYRGWAVGDDWTGVEIGPWQPYATIAAWRPRR
ncbi:MAG: hypothetical protein H6644_03780 [Caldilineaceae bacterium]|nr:hypothetical protein [Caldilineaceae bacterium]